MINTHAQNRVDEDEWPPDQKKVYISPVFIQHQEQRNQQQDNELAKLAQTGDTESLASGQLALIYHRKLVSYETVLHVLNTSTVTKQASDILTPLEEKDLYRMGKSALLKHIACQWEKKNYC